MNGSWFFDENFNDVPDDFFDDAMECIDFPLEDVESNDAIEDWDAKFQHLVPPPFAGFAFGDDCNDLKFLKSRSISRDESSQPKQSQGKYSRPLWSSTSSPVSVLESSSSSSSSAENPKLDIPVKRPRSKRPPPPPRGRTFPFATESWWGRKNCATEKRPPKKKNPPESRKCTHCEITKTPQWREGPMGPKTLCNACGVRYRSGRLFPEYRPAASPTFVPAVHSNSHRKVVEMRKMVRNLE